MTIRGQPTLNIPFVLIAVPAVAVMCDIGMSAIAFGLISCFWVYRSIARPVASLIKSTDEVSTYGLTMHIGTERKDKVGVVQSSVAAMAAKLKMIEDRS